MGKDNKAFGGDLPMGFSMALAQNTAAFEQFSRMPPEERQKILDGVKGIRSKQEMRAYVDRMVNGGFQ